MSFGFPSSQSELCLVFTLAEMAKLAVFGCLEKYMFTLFCFDLRKAQKSHCDIGNLKVGVCLQLHGQVSRQPKHCRSAMLDPMGRAFCCDSGSL